MYDFKRNLTASQQYKIKWGSAEKILFLFTELSTVKVSRPLTEEEQSDLNQLYLIIINALQGQKESIECSQ